MAQISVLNATVSDLFNPKNKSGLDSGRPPVGLVGGSGWPGGSGWLGGSGVTGTPGIIGNPGIIGTPNGGNPIGNPGKGINAIAGVGSEAVNRLPNFIKEILNSGTGAKLASSWSEVAPTPSKVFSPIDFIHLEDKDLPQLVITPDSVAGGPNITVPKTIPVAESDTMIVRPDGKEGRIHTAADGTTTEIVYYPDKKATANKKIIDSVTITKPDGTISMIQYQLSSVFNHPELAVTTFPDSTTITSYFAHFGQRISDLIWHPNGVIIESVYDRYNHKVIENQFITWPDSSVHNLIFTPWNRKEKFTRTDGGVTEITFSPDEADKIIQKTYTSIDGIKSIMKYELTSQKANFWSVVHQDGTKEETLWEKGNKILNKFNQHGEKTHETITNILTGSINSTDFGNNSGNSHGKNPNADGNNHGNNSGNDHGKNPNANGNDHGNNSGNSHGKNPNADGSNHGNNSGKNPNANKKLMADSYSLFDDQTPTWTPAGISNRLMSLQDQTGVDYQQLEQQRSQLTKLIPDHGGVTSLMDGNLWGEKDGVHTETFPSVIPGIKINSAFKLD